MPTYPSILAGQRITASVLTSMLPLTVVKAADQSVTSSTTLVNDTALVLPVAANATYLFDCYLDYEGGPQGSSDLKWTWVIVAGAFLRYAAPHITTAGAASAGSTYSGATTVTAGSGGAGTLMGVEMHGTLVVDVTAGTIQLQWAQNTSNGTATIVHAQSSLSLTRTS